MRIIFAGTPQFAEVALRALHGAGHEIVLVLTQPDREAGRGLKKVLSPVKKASEELGLPISQPESFKKPGPQTDAIKEKIHALYADLMVVAAYGLILPADVLAMPRYGCLNIHASLLPRWRGAAPIARAIQAADAQTGVCIMQMEEGLDTGPVWASQKTPIHENDNFQSLHDRLAKMGSELLVDLLRDFPPPNQVPIAQPSEGVTYANKISKQEGLIDWTMPAQRVANHIRAFDPSPGAYSFLEGEMVKVFEPVVVNQPLKNAPLGQIIKADAQGVWVACQDGAVSLGALQRPGAKRLGYREFLNGKRVSVGSKLISQKEI